MTGTSSSGHHAEVAARDHHAVGGVDDPVEVLDRARPLDLRDDRDVVAAALLQRVCDPVDVVGVSHEGGRDEVGVRPRREVEFGLVPPR